MKKHFLLFFLALSALGFSQNQSLADDYFKRGEFEKALLAYQKLNNEKPGSFRYLFNLVATHQQLQQYDDAEALLKSRIKNSSYPVYLVELGYNYQLKQKPELADKYYKNAILKLEEKPVYVTSVARQFESHSLLDFAIEAYKKGKQLDPNKNYSIQLAQIYGEQGNIEDMFSNYADYVVEKPEYLNTIKRAFNEFISEDSNAENNIILKKILLKKLQAQPDVYWYDLLSWLFVQEKAYQKSFTQEKALFRRNPESLGRIVQLAITTMEAKQYDLSSEIFNYVLKNTQNSGSIIRVEQYLLEIETLTATTEKAYQSIDKKYKSLFETYGIYSQTLALQIAYADFMSFHLHQPEAASKFLKQTLKLSLSSYQEATVKLKLGDILVYQEKFNEALIYYSQIQTELKSSVIAQNARFKVAKTSYYKGDFDWAESQLKILKSSTSQLTANDALDLKLLISDNKFEDSLQVALKLYAKADLMAFQNKTDEAITLLGTILTTHKGESIEDQALLKQAKLYEDKKDYDNAIKNYNAIISNYPDDILADDAYYFLAELYNTVLNQPEKAKPLYEAILFNHEDSIYFIEARKKFRQLRGDTIN
ncbi:tetratricopeptide repeat protein [Lacinutrix undariae]